MNLSDRGLLREVILVVVVKLALILALWWAFIDEAQVSVDPAVMASQFAATPDRQHSTPGDRNAQ